METYDCNTPEAADTQICQVETHELLTAHEQLWQSATANRFVFCANMTKPDGRGNSFPVFVGTEEEFRNFRQGLHANDEQDILQAAQQGTWQEFYYTGCPISPNGSSNTIATIIIPIWPEKTETDKT